MRMCWKNKLEVDESLLTADSEYSSTFPVANVLDRRRSKRWRSYRAPNMMLYGNCDNANSPTIDGPAAAAVNGTWVLDETIRHEGTGSWCLTKTSAAGGGNANAYLQDGAGTADMHGLTVGKTYRMIVRLRTNTTVGNTGIIFYQRFAAAWNSTAVVRNANQNVWELSTDFATITTATTGIMLYVYIASAADPGTKLWIDSVKFFEKNEEIEYGKCEAADAPSLDGGTSALTNATFARSAVQKYTGTYSWALTKTSAGGAGDASVLLQDNLVTTDMHGLVAGKTYNLSMAVRTDVNPATYAAQAILFQYYGGVWNASLYFLPAAANTWRWIESSVTINPATTGIALQLNIPSAAPVNTVLYVDLISMFQEARIFVDMYSPEAPDYFALSGHNLSASARVYLQNTVSFFPGPDWTTTVYSNPPVSIPVTVADLMVYFPTGVAANEYWSILILDEAGNEDGYIEVGFAALGAYDQYNGVDISFDEMIDDKGVVAETETGEVLGTDGAVLREWNIKIPDVYTATKTQIETMLATVRRHTPFVWLADENLLTDFPERYVRFVEHKFTHTAGYKLWEFSATLREAN